MRQSSFPTFAPSALASCFSCGSSLGVAGEAPSSGHAIGHGARQGTCPACQLITYFDVLQVAESGAGFYIGLVGETGPVSRESARYWPKRGAAEAALAEGTWPRREA